MSGVFAVGRASGADSHLVEFTVLVQIHYSIPQLAGWGRCVASCSQIEVVVVVVLGIAVVGAVEAIVAAVAADATVVHVAAVVPVDVVVHDVYLPTGRRPVSFRV